MTDITVGIKQDGTDDYTTLAAAEAASDVSAGRYIMEIRDNGTYTTSATVVGSVGTDTIDNYVWLTVAHENRHYGDPNGAHATATTSAISLFERFSRISWLHFTSGAKITTGYYGGLTDVLISYCIFEPVGSGRSINTNPNGTGTVYSVDNCLFLNGYNSPIGISNDLGNVETYDINIDFCTIYNGIGGWIDKRINLKSNEPASNITVNIHNTVAVSTNNSSLDVGTSSPPTGTVVWNGSNNMISSAITDLLQTDNTINWQTVARANIVDVAQPSGAYAVFTDLTPGSEDFTPRFGAGNLLIGNGINRIGSEPDPRQDFTVDIRGNRRSTLRVDIGAIQTPRTWGPDIGRPGRHNGAHDTRRPLSGVSR